MSCIICPMAAGKALLLHHSEVQKQDAMKLSLSTLLLHKSYYFLTPTGARKRCFFSAGFRICI